MNEEGSSPSRRRKGLSLVVSPGECRRMTPIDSEPPFCEVGCLLALQVSRASAAAIERVYDGDPHTLQGQLIVALAELIEHVRGNGVTARCPNCWED